MGSSQVISWVSKQAHWHPWTISVTFVLANICDALSTFAGLNRGAMEANILMGGLMETTSISTALIIKVLLALALSIVVVRWKPRALVVPTLVLTLVAASNILITLAFL